MGLGTLGLPCWIVSYGCFANQVPLPPMFSDFSCEVRAVKCFPLSLSRSRSLDASIKSLHSLASFPPASDSKSNAKGGKAGKMLCACVGSINTNTNTLEPAAAAAVAAAGVRLKSQRKWQSLIECALP